MSKNAEKRKREKARRRDAVVARSLHDSLNPVKQTKREAAELEQAEQTFEGAFDSKPGAR